METTTLQSLLGQVMREVDQQRGLFFGMNILPDGDGFALGNTQFFVSDEFQHMIMTLVQLERANPIVAKKVCQQITSQVQERLTTPPQTH